MCRSGPASPCGSRRSITARSDIQGTSGPFVSRWNNEENMQGDRQRRAVSRELRRPVARLGVDEWRRSSARLPRRNLRRLQGAPRRRHGVRRPDAGRRHDPCLPGEDRLRSRDCDRGGARADHPAGARGRDRSARARRGRRRCRIAEIAGNPSRSVLQAAVSGISGKILQPDLSAGRPARTIACCTFTSERCPTAWCRRRWAAISAPGTASS